jgi:hypothetical protein
LPLTQTKKTDNILKKLYYDISNGFRYIQDVKTKLGPSFYKLRVERITNINQIPKPTTFPPNAFPPEVRNHIDEYSIGLLTYSFDMFDRKISIIFLTEDDRVESLIETYNNYVDNMLVWLYIVDIYSSKKCANQLKIFIYHTSLLKNLPGSNIEILNENNVNTAFTRTCPIDSEIVVFRKEEWFKVFMHETFHCFGLDFSAYSNSDSNKCILSIFPAIDPNLDVRLYETFCEMWAELFHMLFCLFYVPLDGDGDKLKDRCIPFSKQRFISTLSNERIFSIYQSNKLLRYSGYTYKDLFATPMRGHSTYTEKTPAFSYYVIKSLMLWNLDMFIDWCLKYANVGESSPPIQFDKDNIAKYCDFVRELTRNDKRYRRAVEKRWHPKRRSFNVAKTLRMTSIDIEE